MKAKTSLQPELGGYIKQGWKSYLTKFFLTKPNPIQVESQITRDSWRPTSPLPKLDFILDFKTILILVLHLSSNQYYLPKIW